MLVLYSSWVLLKEAVAVLMEEAPGHVDEVRDAVIAIPGVRAVSDLHVWTITSGMVSLSAHVAVEESRPYREMLVEIREVLHDGLGSTTKPCNLSPRA